MSNTSRREALRATQLAEAKAARFRKIVGIGVGLVAVAVVAVLVVVLVNGIGSSGSATYPKNVTETKDAVQVYGGSTKAGAPTIDVYLDFQCPICRVAEEKYGATLADLAKSGDIKLVQHTLTFMDDNLKNTASTRAAVAVTCADSYGDKYAAMTTAVYANQAAVEEVGSEGYADKLLRETLPAQVGITGDALSTFQKCYDNQSPRKFLDDVAAKSYVAGVTGTPTFKRNGVVLKVNPSDGAAGPATTVDAFKSLLLNGS